MNITKQDLLDQRELIQDDLFRILKPSVNVGQWNDVCQVINNRIKILEDKLDEFTSADNDFLT